MREWTAGVRHGARAARSEVWGSCRRRAPRARFSGWCETPAVTKDTVFFRGKWKWFWRIWCFL